MTPFEIELYRLINGAFTGTSNKLTLPQILSAIGKQDAPPTEKSSIASLLHDADFQRVLWQVGTHLWIGHDQKFRIVDVLAMKRLRQEVGKGMCRLCLIDEDDPGELIRDDKKTYVHPLCQHRFHKLQQWKAMK